MYFISAWYAVACGACFSGGMVDLVGWFAISVWVCIMCLDVCDCVCFGCLLGFGL